MVLTLTRPRRSSVDCILSSPSILVSISFDRVFYRIDTKESIASLLKAAIKVIMIQQRLSKEDVNKIIKHAFIIPLQQFDDLKNEICR